jgi:nucleoside-diphosphate-sugar epimerase
MYGPGDDASKFTTYVLHACHRNDPALRLTAGEQMRDFVYIDDVVSAYATLLEQSDSLESTVDIDVGSGDAPAVRKFVEIVHALTKSNSELQFGAVAYRPNEAMFCKADIARMQALGWQPKFDLSTGIKKTIELEF